MTALVSLTAGVFGLLFGSFASVPIHRWPAGGTVLETAALTFVFSVLEHWRRTTPGGWPSSVTTPAAGARPDRP